MDAQERIVGSATSTALDTLRAYYLHNPQRLYFYVISLVLIVLCLSMAVINRPDVVYMLSFWLIIIFPVLALTVPISISLMHNRLNKEQKVLSYEIDGEKISIQSASGTSLAVSWKDIRTARQYRSGVAIGLKPGGGLWLPRRAFTAEGMNVLTRLIGQKT